MFPGHQPARTKETEEIQTQRWEASRKKGPLCAQLQFPQPLSHTHRRRQWTLMPPFVSQNLRDSVTSKMEGKSICMQRTMGMSDPRKGNSSTRTQRKPGERPWQREVPERLLVPSTATDSGASGSAPGGVRIPPFQASAPRGEAGGALPSDVSASRSPCGSPACPVRVVNTQRRHRTAHFTNAKES